MYFTWAGGVASMDVRSAVRRGWRAAWRGRPDPGGTGTSSARTRSTSAPAVVDTGTGYHQPYNDYTGEEPEISMEQLVRRRATDLKFRLAVNMYTAYSVGVGMSHSADEGNREGRAALEIVDAFCEEQDIDSLNQRVASDVWAAGNAFVYPVQKKRPARMTGLRLIPLSSIVSIRRDIDGDIVAYRQRTRQGDRYLEPGDVLHFAWLPEDASAWGTGLGQPLARAGMGYMTANGKRTRRPPWFEISEMTDDVAAKITYAGMPRYSISMPGLDDQRMADVTRVFSGLEPLQHIVNNFDTKVETIALDTASRFDSFLTKLDNQMVAGVMSPIPRLWSSLNFTYASSKEALAATFPLIHMYQRAHARFVERQIYGPIIMQAGRDPAKAKVRVSWGTREPLDVEGLSKVIQMLGTPAMEGRIDPESIITMIQEAGVPVEKAEDPPDPNAPAQGGGMAKDLRDLRRIRDEYAERRVPVSALPPDEQYRALRLALMRRVVGASAGGNGHAAR